MDGYTENMDNAVLDTLIDTKTLEITTDVADDTDSVHIEDDDVSNGSNSDADENVDVVYNDATMTKSRRARFINDREITQNSITNPIDMSNIGNSTILVNEPTYIINKEEHEESGIAEAVTDFVTAIVPLF